MKFRKKPVVIEAVKVAKYYDDPVPQWFTDAVASGTITLHGMGKFTRDVPWVEIQTLEGVMRGNQGDWIIRGVAGEIYSCKPDIFAATYEPADSQLDDFTKYDISRKHFIKTGKLNPPTLKEYSRTIGNLLVLFKLSNSWTWGEITNEGHLKTHVVGVNVIENIAGRKALQILIGPVMIMAMFVNVKRK